jgi:histidine triad (HIT) family protein
MGGPGPVAAPPCIFCAIAQKKAPAYVIYEDGETMAFLDIAPLSRGHTLIIPKAHVDRITDLPPDRYASVLATVTEICRRMERLSRDYNIGVNQGPLAGQIVFHLHFHVIPRYPNQVGGFPRERLPLGREEAERLLRELGPG